MKMRRTVDGRFYAREVKRTLPDVVYFTVYLGVGGYLNACTMDKLHEHMKMKQRYVNLSRQEFEQLVRRTDNMVHNFWTIEIDGDIITVR